MLMFHFCTISRNVFATAVICDYIENMKQTFIFLTLPLFPEPTSFDVFCANIFSVKMNVMFQSDTNLV